MADMAELQKAAIERLAERLYRGLAQAFRTATERVLEAQRKDWQGKIAPWDLGKVGASLKAADEARDALLKEVKALVDSFIPQAFWAERREAFSRGKSPQVVIEEGASALQGRGEPPLTPEERRVVRALAQFTYETYKTVASEWHGRVRTAIALGVLRGDDMNIVSRRIRQQTGIRLSDAERIARTETARVSQAARLVEYRERRVEKLDWVLAIRPCEVCQDAARGAPYERDRVPALPVHPNCMCAVAPVVEELPTPTTPEEGWEPMVIDDGYTDLELARIYRMLNHMPPEDRARMIRFLSDPDTCPVILRPEQVKRRFGIDFVAKYGEGYQPYVDWIGLYDPRLNRPWVLPEHRDGALIHELAHQYHYHGMEPTSMHTHWVNVHLRQLYQKAKERGWAVTEYALSDVTEYFAEGVKYFIQKPRELHALDPEMYRFLNTEVFPGTYKRLPKPGEKLSLRRSEREREEAGMGKFAEYEVVVYHGHPEAPVEELVGRVFWDAEGKRLAYEAWDEKLAQILAEVKGRRAVKRFARGPGSGPVIADNIVEAPMDDPKFLIYLHDWLLNCGFALKGVRGKR